MHVFGAHCPQGAHSMLEEQEPFGCMTNVHTTTMQMEEVHREMSVNKSATFLLLNHPFKSHLCTCHPPPNPRTPSV